MLSDEVFIIIWWRVDCYTKILSKRVDYSTDMSSLFYAFGRSVYYNMVESRLLYNIIQKGTL